MPALSLFLGGLLTSIASFFATLVTKKTAFGLSMVTAYGVLVVGITAAISSSITAAKSSVAGLGGLPSDVVAGMAYFAPDNLVLCLGLCLAGRAQVWAYLWSYRNLKLFSQS